MLKSNEKSCMAKEPSLSCLLSKALKQGTDSMGKGIFVSTLIQSKLKIFAYINYIWIQSGRVKKVHSAQRAKENDVLSPSKITFFRQNNYLILQGEFAVNKHDTFWCTFLLYFTNIYIVGFSYQPLQKANYMYNFFRNYQQIGLNELLL